MAVNRKLLERTARRIAIKKLKTSRKTWQIEVHVKTVQRTNMALGEKPVLHAHHKKALGLYSGMGRGMTGFKEILEENTAPSVKKLTPNT